MEKPPLGLKPKSLHDEDRAHEICSAISRYHAQGKLPPPWWAQELHTLLSDMAIRGHKWECGDA